MPYSSDSAFASLSADSIDRAKVSITGMAPISSPDAAPRSLNFRAPVSTRPFALDENALHGNGSHPELGAVTLREMLAVWVVHDFTHLAQTSILR